ncbi:MAG TPA: cyclase family protein [Blastocatellia bacterium]|nr:cyclase family protein [Blastocatellia bacterium]
MVAKIISLVVLASLFTTGCAKRDAYPSGHWVDLSYDLSSETVYWPTAEPFKLETVSEGMTEKGYYYSAYKFCAAEHGGTHIDAPIHFAQGRNTVDEIPLTQLVAPAVKIDVSQKALANRDYQIGIEDLESWESSNGKIPDGSIVLLQTGYGRHWPDRVRYLGTDRRGPEGVSELHFPGLHPEAAGWLVRNRRVNAVGIDTASIDYGQSQTFDSHVTLMGENIPALENVANMDKVPTSGAQLIALPIKIKGGSGGPVRIVAFVPDGAR